MNLSVEIIAFYAFAGLVVLSAIVILFTRNVLYAAFSLLLTFLGISAVYVLAGADFLAVMQILVYVGGVLVLLVFGVMLTNQVAGKSVRTQHHNQFWGLLIGGALFFLLAQAIWFIDMSSLVWLQTAKTVQASTVSTLGIQLMSDFILPFELTAVLLLVALIGAAYVAQRQL
ncbi:NADH-quinone oxidoreductase subunit J family protein [Tunicatimonas pelagia]|uniref:NADH-quinone oxidoreductase subunit J family protein n=1 Tax=Tunicatimonas pelagia TaxID=931531 RepID=UPI002665234C|nr:NADH-quinone oxidoreductase subunit J [Tunicatimonas pelagia]WKN45558.1 NADH-quinone oxidoreductase subunit J [Tunicatimonas pelagia]